MIPRNKIDDVLNASDIVELITSYGVKLRKAGSIYKGLCPFHNEKTPSFTVSEAKQRFHCYGCGVGGNAIDFVMQYRNIGFIDAVKELAEHVHIIIEEERLTPEQQKQESFRQGLLKVYEDACRFYESQMNDTTGGRSVGGQYADSRFESETIADHRLGYAPDSWSALWDFLKQKGYKDDVLVASGLFRENKYHTYYDFFRSRLMFPICDRLGRVIAFSGRDISGDDTQAKYINTGETAIYKKGHVLYGLNLAAANIRKYDVCVLVEGNADVVKMHQIGIYNVVASCGTALTDEQIDIIGKYTKNIALMYDNDQAGRTATNASAEKILANGLNALVLLLPEKIVDGVPVKVDPDTAFEKAEDFTKFYEGNIVSYPVLLAKKYADKCKNNPDKKDEIIKSIAKLFYQKDEAAREAMIDELSKIIKPKTAWAKALRLLNKDEAKRAKELEENGRTAEQNKSIENYGFYCDKNCYYFMNSKGEGFYQGSNFVMEPLMHIQSALEAKRLFKITNNFGRCCTIEFAQRELVSLQAFMLKVENLGNFRFTGGDFGLAKIKAYLYEHTKSCIEISQLGWQSDGGFWAWGNGIYADGSFIEVNDDGIANYNAKNYYLPAFSSFYMNDPFIFQFERSMRYKDGPIKFRTWASKFMNVYGPNAIIGIGFLLAAVNRDIIFNQFKFFPILNVFGPPQTGKTKFALSLCKLFGNRIASVNLANATKAGLNDHVGKGKNVIQHIDEFKNNIEYDRVEFLKGIWDGVGRTRINIDKDRKKETTPVDAAIILTGQEMTTADVALFTRVIYTTMDKTTFTEMERQRYEELMNWENEGLTNIVHEILDCRGYFVANYMDNYAQCGKDMTKFVDKMEIDDRIWSNWLVILTAYKVLSTQLSLPMDYNNVLLLMCDKMRLQQKEIRSNDELSVFWNIFTFMVRDGEVEEGYDYRVNFVNELKTDKLDLKKQMKVLTVDLTRIIQLYMGKNSPTQKLLPEASIKHYLLNSRAYLGSKTARFKMRSRNLNDLASVKIIGVDESMDKVEKLATFTRRGYCFDYDMLGLEIEREYVEEWNYDDIKK